MTAAIFVISCWRNYARREAIRNTWAKLSALPVRFIVGKPVPAAVPSPSERDVITVDAGDSYMSLPAKVHALMEGARAYDKILKVDDDVFVAADRLTVPTENYLGMVTRNMTGSVRYCHGGAGYWLSRKAMEAVWGADPSGLSEDSYVARACEWAGISPTHDNRYAVEMGPEKWAFLPRQSNDRLVTGEFSAEELSRALKLYQYDDREENMSADEYRDKVLRRKP